MPLAGGTGMAVKVVKCPPCWPPGPGPKHTILPAAMTLNFQLWPETPPLSFPRSRAPWTESLHGPSPTPVLQACRGPGARRACPSCCGSWPRTSMPGRTRTWTSSGKLLRYAARGGKGLLLGRLAPATVRADVRVSARHPGSTFLQEERGKVTECVPKLGQILKVTCEFITFGLPEFS